MKSQLTSCTHVGETRSELTVEFGASGSKLKYTATVPAGTKVGKREGYADQWIVDDLSFIEDKSSLMYHEADHYGIRIPESEIVNIRAA
ncbi:hypothetical protein ACK249_005157 [Pseudomonas aeruginosa]|uniref:hypothetical protein n=1 Tax=Pseudomonas aeruginosa TaxID=287 RepID=UPI00155E2812|nr:hypothetical protein [Pseudomonas aeruginosa]EIU2702109.1 hypothetical protein [Pseudomonas aeruginosa]EKW9640703.1 hypothetical protein [Pseudomonas aeruginosa]NRC34194.1 hypothetical protein [Pseudomonas aeruginosa]